MDLTQLANLGEFLGGVAALVMLYGRLGISPLQAVSPIRG